ncbi:MAG: riboflavin synthase [Chitinophagales bacterium]
MFTGIIEFQGKIARISRKGGNRTFIIHSTLTPELKVDQSIAHDGACLTVEAIEGEEYQVTAIAETLKKTNLSNWKTGDWINLERCLLMNGRLDGHWVQGHVDQVATCLKIKELEGSWEYEFEIDKKFAHLLVEKGSICLQGISLTVFGLKKKSFRVAIIPYTYEHTNIKNIEPGKKANVEFDVIGKYIARKLSL